MKWISNIQHQSLYGNIDETICKQISNPTLGIDSAQPTLFVQRDSVFSGQTLLDADMNFQSRTGNTKISDTH